MRQKKFTSNGKTLHMAFLFLGLVALLIIGSFISKVVHVAKQGLFDGQHRLTILFESKPAEKGTLISFAPDKKTISILEIEGEAFDYKKLSVGLGIPIDGYVRLSAPIAKQSDALQNGEILSLLKKGLFGNDVLQTNVTPIDFVRLWLFTKSIPGYDMTEEKYRLASLSDELVNTGLDKVVALLFADKTLSEEKVSIHIINASGVTGLGNKLARLLTNSGGNVVAVSTGNAILPRCEIGFIEEDTYTLEKIEKLLGCKTIQMKKQTISDIVITLGKDKANFFAL